jgi:hypothetical protein
MMQAGEYYVGDLCYVMDDQEWKEFCNLIIQGNRVIDGEFELPDGRKFATYSTAHGDGYYRDQYGNHYSVDAGLIGCIKLADIKVKKYNDISKLGAIHKFELDFATSGGRSNPEWDGVICIGGIKIDTDGWYDDEDEVDCDDE